jgi:hypothetical protein
MRSAHDMAFMSSMDMVNLLLGAAAVLSFCEEAVVGIWLHETESELLVVGVFVTAVGVLATAGA